MKRNKHFPFLLALFCTLFLQTTLHAQERLPSPCVAEKTAYHQDFESNSTKIELAASIMKSKGILLFFMNPNGRPCQVQGKILNEIKAEIEKHYLVKQVKTTDPSDRSLFYRFGVRSMPLIILLNKNGSVKHRFTPGIHSHEQLLNAMQQKN